MPKLMIPEVENASCVLLCFYLSICKHFQTYCTFRNLLIWQYISVY